MTLDRFHPAVVSWFTENLGVPTACQAGAWEAISAGRHTLIAAPTGSGKTLAGFLSAIDALVRESRRAPLPDATRVLYVSPLKALGNDVHKNLEVPLAGIDRALAGAGGRESGIRAMVRSGDTPGAARESMRRQPPHILVTTPESLYILLTSGGGRAMLECVETAIVDEIHAVAGNKRGAHLALSLERLDALAGRPVTRIGLSATQRPIETVANFLSGCDGGRARECTIVDTGHRRERDLALELPESPLEAVMSGEVWQEVYRRLCTLIEGHRTTLVFVNTRRMAERVARALTESLGEENVTSHHGSLSRERRLSAERRLKAGDLKVLVATASLELGIDIGDVDLVCQLGSTRSISTFLQRAGRAGHAVHGTPKARLFPLTRDDLVECAAILDAVRRGELDRLQVPSHPLDVLGQQVVAMVAAEDWGEDALLAAVRRAWPYRELGRERWRRLLAMLAGGFATRRGRRGAYLHHDVINRELRARRGARLTAMTSGGAIPDNADYDVRLEPHGTYLGSLNEDFAIESLPGDIFQLGNTSWRILRIERSTVRVEDARGLPPNLPFWLGEAPGRTGEVSEGVCDLLGWLGRRFEAKGAQAVSPESRLSVASEFAARTGAGTEASAQIVDYLCAAHAALGALPDRDTLVLERFFDESGGMQLVIHSRFGSRLNRAFGLALRKRFCRKFNFELQAAATEDAIVLSLSESHSFALDEVCRYLAPETVREVLTQALLDAPMFNVRWRWNANVSLAVPRFRSGSKVPANIQRMQAEDLVAAVFPDQIACAENLAGAREIPDHPLVEQTIADALTEAMDIDGLEALVARLSAGEIRVVARDLAEPSPLAAEVLDARPYAFLDDAPLEERRARAVTMRRSLDPESAADIGRLDASAIDRVREEAWPEAATPDEAHDALVVLGFATATEAATGRPAGTGSAERPLPGGERAGWSNHLHALTASGRATRFHASPGGPVLWCAAERLALLEAALGAGCAEPPLALPEVLRDAPERDAARVELLRARLGCLGPISAADMARDLGLGPAEVEGALAALEAEGSVLRGRFTPGAASLEWCERRLLARIHRYTLGRLRREIEPASRAELARFLFEWQRVRPDDRRHGVESLAAVIAELEGFAAPAAAWEDEILPARIADFTPEMLDRLCLAGRASWARPVPPVRETPSRSFGPIRSTPIALFSRQGRRRAALWLAPHATDFDGSNGTSPPSGAMAPGPAGDGNGSGESVAPSPRTRESGIPEGDPVWRTTPLSMKGPRRWIPASAGMTRTTSDTAPPEPDAAPLDSRARVQDGGPSRGPERNGGRSVRKLPRSRHSRSSGNPRETIDHGNLREGAGAPPASLSPGARRILTCLSTRGASFFDDILAETGAHAPDAAAALGELITHGLVSADGFAGLRAFTGASTRRLRAVAEAGRWSCVTRRSADAGGVEEGGIEAIARTLLRRYGVVFKTLLARETLTVPWRELLRELRRLEARGDIRGGRFVAGFTGEQYALPEAVETLRRVRRAPADGAIVALSAADPLNLTGIITLGDRVPATASTRIAFRDGVPVATQAGNRKIDWLDAQTPEQEWAVRNTLLRKRIPVLGISATLPSRTL